MLITICVLIAILILSAIGFISSGFKTNSVFAYIFLISLITFSIYFTAPFILLNSSFCTKTEKTYTLDDSKDIKMKNGRYIFHLKNDNPIAIQYFLVKVKPTKESSYLVESTPSFTHEYLNKIYDQYLIPQYTLYREISK